MGSVKGTAYAITLGPVAPQKAPGCPQHIVTKSIVRYGACGALSHGIKN